MSLRDFRRAGHPATLLSAFLYFDISFMVWVILGPLGPFIGEAYKLTATQKGLLTAVPPLGGAFFRLILGWMTEHIGGRRTGLIGLGVTLLPLTIAWKVAGSFTGFLGVGLLLGVAGASFAAALPLGVPLSKPDLIAAIRAKGLRSVSSVFNVLAGGKEDPASKPGLASLLQTLWHEEYEDERDARFINDRVHANIQNDGTFSVIPQMAGGVTSPDQLRRIADVADKYDVPLVKLTGGQRIDLLGIKKDDLPNVWRDLGMPSGFAYGKRFRTCKSCVGTDFCRFGVGDSTSLAIKIEMRFQGIDSPGKLKLATAGCPRNCSEAMVKDLGAVAVEGGKWEIYIGGAAGAHVRKGDILGVVDSHEQVLLYMGRFIQYYRENAKYLERTYGFVERLGIEKLRKIIMDDSEGIAARLDLEMQKTVAAYRDPWKEAYAPATPNQFVSILPVMQLG